MQVQRVNLAAAAASIALAALPSQAGAATVVHTDSEHELYLGLPAFDVSLGTLNSVTLSVSATRTRDWFVIVPGNPPTRQASYDLTAALFLNGPGLSTTMNLVSGSGQQTVAMESAGSDSPFFEGPVSVGHLSVDFAGSASFSLDPAFFLSSQYDGSDPDPVVFAAFVDGYNSAGPDSAGMYGPINVNGASQLVLVEGSCGQLDFNPPEDWCGTTNYTLTYNYTPAAAAVPEPGTWAMMLVGFGAIGFSLRKRRAGRGTSGAAALAN